VLAAGSSQLDPQLYAQMRETLQRSPSVQQMMETAEQGKRPSGPEQIELQKQMMQLLKQALAVQKASPAKPSGGGQPAETPRPMNLPRNSTPKLPTRPAFTRPITARKSCWIIFGSRASFMPLRQERATPYCCGLHERRLPARFPAMKCIKTY
jgi:hypothetical protein